MKALEDYDLTIPHINNIISIQTDSYWSLDNLTTSDHWILSLSTGGGAEYSWGQKTYQLRKDDMLFFQEGFSRSAKSSPQDPWQFIVVKFRLEALNDRTAQALRELPNIFPGTTLTIRQSFLEMERVWRGRRPGYLLRCKSALYDLLYTMMRQAGTFYDKDLPHQEKLRHALEIINQNREENFSLQELAREAGLSPSYFRMLFKRFTGYSTVQYQNYMKITHAQDLLNTGNLRVTEVAGMVGIRDIYYFSRLFKQITGIAPSDLCKK
ncbi:MAG: AraC family transcriptional regulator [Candidatus Limiplasma sp.]|nr:AraC family transcriptional regulator [Candidatus Limiplasma sp.]